MADKLKDIDHTPPHGDGANTVWRRGTDIETDEATAVASDGDTATADD